MTTGRINQGAEFALLRKNIIYSFLSLQLLSPARMPTTMLIYNFISTVEHPSGLSYFPPSLSLLNPFCMDLYILIVHESVGPTNIILHGLFYMFLQRLLYICATTFIYHSFILLREQQVFPAVWNYFSARRRIMIIDTGQRVEPAVSTRKTLVFGIQGSLGMSYQNCIWHYKAYES